MIHNRSVFGRFYFKFIIKVYLIVASLFNTYILEAYFFSLGTVGLTSLDSLLYCAIKVNLENVLNGVRNGVSFKTCSYIFSFLLKKIYMASLTR